VNDDDNITNCSNIHQTAQQMTEISAASSMSLHINHHILVIHVLTLG